jgi:hypothetical protein
MSDTLAQLITKVQAALGDDGTYYTTAILTAAARAALSEWNERAPDNAGDLVDVVAGQKEYSVYGVDTRAMSMIDVLKKDISTSGEDDTSLAFDEYTEDARLYIRLRDAWDSGTLIFRFTIPHTINGLDGETTSSLPAIWDAVLVAGMAYHGCIIRSVARVEPINLNSDVAERLSKVQEFYKEQFTKGLDRAAQQLAPVGKPKEFAWNDEWHNWPGA